MITVKKSEYNKAKLRKLFREVSQQYIQITDEEAQELGLIEQGPIGNTEPQGPAGEIDPIINPTGNTETEDPNHDYSKDYLTFTVLNSNTKISFNTPGLSYSLDNGITWDEFPYNTGINISIANTKILFKGLMKHHAEHGVGNFGCSQPFDISGNIMSLIYGDNFINKYTLNDYYIFESLFSGTPCINANNLILPATTLSGSCYSLMFANCTSLTTAPVLPATNLSANCYMMMFFRCSSLTTAPELLAKNTIAGCYEKMFWKCYNLNYIKCLKINDDNWYGSNNYWVSYITTSGTFIKHKDAQWEIGENGIPEGWEIIEVDE